VVADRQPTEDPRRWLRADCGRCFGLCCVVPAFAASADFAIDKPANTPCRHLGADARCGIHDQLRPKGFTGCTVYDCFGAGQQVAQVTFGGTDWRAAPQTAPRMFATFTVQRHLHELLWYLAEARTLAPTGALREALLAAFTAVQRLAAADADVLLALDVAAHRGEVGQLLTRTSELARAGAGGPGPDHRGADLIGARLAGADLRAASLRGAYLIGADLSGADLRWADVIGADLRGADLRGTDLREAIFLIQSQLDAACGDAATVLPSRLTRPARWATTVPVEHSP
jgi:uncharacterized protein YjbI with pentapeptide repeats